MIQVKKKPVINWELLIKVLIPCLSFFGGMVFNAVIFANSIATKPYVEARADEVRKYTDQKAAESLKDAIEHSESAQAAMMLKISNETADLKAEIRALAAKQDLMLSFLNKKH